MVLILSSWRGSNSNYTTGKVHAAKKSSMDTEMTARLMAGKAAKRWIERTWTCWEFLSGACALIRVRGPEQCVLMATSSCLNWGVGVSCVVRSLDMLSMTRARTLTSDPARLPCTSIVSGSREGTTVPSRSPSLFLLSRQPRTHRFSLSLFSFRSERHSKVKDTHEVSRA